MSDDEEDIFVEHFMLHGVTPKQFERIMKSAKRIPVPQGQFLIRKGEPMENLFLVVKGSTRAHILGRHLTAASTDHIRKGETREGGNSGAWIGEMAFLDYYWAKQQGQESEEVSKSIYTICAHTDCEVLAWSHSDMESLMESSTDVRAALTRAMTSALVGKVVNMTISRSSKVLPNWSSWLADWRSSDGLTVRLHSVEGLPEDKRGFRLEPEQQQQQQQQQLQQQPRVA
uniref:Cyclic nucleotide-binding domain-containing protein n=1 Tax=Craspedostauros australis TaxID=1486917 RepID=A0A7R9ZPB4_9STRA